MNYKILLNNVIILRICMMIFTEIINNSSFTPNYEITYNIFLIIFLNVILLHKSKNNKNKSTN